MVSKRSVDFNGNHIEKTNETLHQFSKETGTNPTSNLVNREDRRPHYYRTHNF